jgi:drug/metabolite transporter (DMT)-like permease
MLYALFGALFYSICYIIYGWAAKEVSFSFLIFVGSVFCSIVTFPFAIKETWDLKTASIIVGERAIWLLASWCVYMAILKVGVRISSIVESSYPLFILLFSLFIYKERPTIPLIVGAALVFLGVSIISYWGKN